MEDFFKQIRVRVSGLENKVDSSSTKKTAPTKTTSFKAEKKKLQNWVQRQFSRQMSQDFDTDGVEKAAAVAAAAYAVLLLKQSSIPQQEKISDGLTPSPPPTKIRKATVISAGSVSELPSDKFPEIPHSKVSDAKIPDEEPAEKHYSPEASVKRPPISTDMPAFSYASSEKVPEYTVEGRMPPFKKAPSFVDKPVPSLEDDPEHRVERMPPFKKAPSFADKPAPSLEEVSEHRVEALMPPFKKASSFAVKPAPSSDKPAVSMQEIPALTEKQLNISINPDDAASKISTPGPNEWEQAELAKVKKRYEKANERIRSWENKKKVKARRKLDNIEGELAMRRAKATEKYQVEMQRIQQIVGAASEKAKERQLYEEAKVKQKASVIRETGKTPSSGFCC